MAEEVAFCPACGGIFNPVVSWGRKDFCSKSCAKRAGIYLKAHGTLEGLPVRVTVKTAKWRELNDPRRARAARMAVRDAAYAKLGVAVTVVDSGDVVVENRGTVPIGFGAVAKVKHG